MNPLQFAKLRVVCFVCALMSAAATAQTVSNQAESRTALTVTTTTAKTIQWPIAIAASGQVYAWQEAVVSARASGLPLITIYADTGKTVRKGEVLARFDDRTARAELAQAQASLAQSQASFNQAKVNADRVLALRGTGAVSDESILQASTQAETTSAQVTVSQANLEAAKVRLENTLVVAPDSGLIVSRSATLGQAVSVTTELFRLIRQNKLEWRAEVGAADLLRIRAGQVAKIVLADGTEVNGTVRQVMPTLSAATRLGLVQVDLKPSSSAKPAMFAQGMIQTGDREALVVAAGTVVIQDGRSYVFSIEGERAKRIAVSTGRRQGEWVEITQGIKNGQVLALRGAGLLSDGDRIRLGAAASDQSKGVKKL